MTTLSITTLALLSLAVFSALCTVEIGGEVHVFTTTSKRIPISKLFGMQQQQLSGRANRFTGIQQGQLSEKLKELEQKFRMEHQQMRKSKLHLLSKQLKSWKDVAALTNMEQSETEEQAGASGSLATGQLDYPSWADTANISAGSPPQSFQVLVIDWDAYLYLIDSNAKYNYRRGDVAVNNKHTFNTSASSTYKANQSAEYENFWVFDAGTVGTDVVALGSDLSATLQFQLANQIDPAMRDSDMDGMLGIAIHDSYSNSSTLPIAQQLVDQLDLPVITKYRYSETYTGSGVVGFGTLLPEKCQPDGWTTVSTGLDMLSYSTVTAFQFNANGISAQTKGESGDCAQKHLDANFTVVVYKEDVDLELSYQMFDMVVQATGAAWDEEEFCYVVAADQLEAANPITLHLESGGTLDLLVQDFVVKKGDVHCLHATLAGYDQTRVEWDFVKIGSQLLNHLCASININTGELKVARSLDQHIM